MPCSQALLSCDLVKWTGLTPAKSPARVKSDRHALLTDLHLSFEASLVFPEGPKPTCAGAKPSLVPPCLYKVRHMPLLVLPYHLSTREHHAGTKRVKSINPALRSPTRMRQLWPLDLHFTANRVRAGSPQRSLTVLQKAGTCVAIATRVYENFL
jgi:hypothetical protein